MSALNPFLRAMPPRKAHSSGWTSGVIRLRRCFVENTQWISSETYVCDTWHLAQFQASRRDAPFILPAYPALKRRATFGRPPDAFCSRNGKASGNDNGSRDLFMTLLKDEERSRRLLEAQVHQIGRASCRER